MGNDAKGVRTALGLLLTGAGAYLFLRQITVRSGFWAFWGRGAGLLLVAFLAGVFLLAVDRRSPAGRLLVGGSALAVVVGVLSNLTFYMRPMNLLNLLLMLAALGAGLGLLAQGRRG